MEKNKRDDKMTTERQKRTSQKADKLCQEILEYAREVGETQRKFRKPAE